MYKILVLSYLLIWLLGCTAAHETPQSLNSHSLKSQKLQPVALQLTTHLGDQQEFVAGDEIQFLLSTDKNAFIYMYYIDADSNIIQIIPNQNQKNNYYSAGYYQPVPASEIPYRFTISKPFGEEVIWIIASDQSITIDFTTRPVGNFNQIHASIDNIKKNIQQQSSQFYGDYSLKILTRKK
jgi:hypothetical protein